MKLHHIVVFLHHKSTSSLNYITKKPNYIVFSMRIFNFHSTHSKSIPSNKKKKKYKKLQSTRVCTYKKNVTPRIYDLIHTHTHTHKPPVLPLTTAHSYFLSSCLYAFFRITCVYKKKFFTIKKKNI